MNDESNIYDKINFDYMSLYPTQYAAVSKSDIRKYRIKRILKHINNG